MNKEIIGSVTNEEKNQLRELFEMKLGLNELFKTLNENYNDEAYKNLYQKIVKETGQNMMDLQLWWKNKSEKYNWKSGGNSNWEINFETNEIYLNNVIFDKDVLS